MSVDEKAAAAWNDYVSRQRQEKIEELERQLAAANERIKQLEAVVNDPEALWTNWLRGTVKLPAGIGDVRQYQDRIKRLEEAGDALCTTMLRESKYLHGENFKASINVWRKAKEAKP